MEAFAGEPEGVLVSQGCGVPGSRCVTQTRGSKWMGWGERAPPDIPSENKQNKNGLLWTGILKQIDQLLLSLFPGY